MHGAGLLANRRRESTLRDYVSRQDLAAIAGRDVTGGGDVTGGSVGRCAFAELCRVSAGQQGSVGQVPRARHRDDHHQVRPVRTRSNLHVRSVHP